MIIIKSDLYLSRLLFCQVQFFFQTQILRASIEPLCNNFIYFSGVGSLFLPATIQGTQLTELDADDSEFRQVEEQMQNTIREHKDSSGGLFNRYHIIKVLGRRDHNLCVI